MKITPKVIVFALVTALLITMFWTRIAAPKFSPFPNPQASVSSTSTVYESKENSGGNVTVTVNPVQLIPDEIPQFRVVFDTHSVNLDFDIAAVTSLIDNQGNSFGQAVWNGSLPGGHHRQGTLTFSSPLAPQTKSLTITIINVAGIASRTFTWEVKKP